MQRRTRGECLLWGFPWDISLTHVDSCSLKFDSGGLFKRSNSEEIIVDTEKDIFDLLDLEYIRKFAFATGSGEFKPDAIYCCLSAAPEWRNCDI